MARLRLLATCLAVLLLTPAALAERLDIPLHVDMRHVEHRLAQALGMDPEGRTRLTQDACNHMDLADLQAAPADQRLRISLAVTVQLGAPLFGECRGPGRWQGRMLVDMTPVVAADGLSVTLRPDTAELRLPDGSEGTLTAPTRALAEQLILPRMRGATVDLREPLAAIDTLIHRSMPPGAGVPTLTDRIRIGTVDVVEDGVRASLLVQVTPPPEGVPEPPLDASELAEWQRVEDELDGFLTVVIGRLAGGIADRDMQLELLAVLLDARWAIARALAEDNGEKDPVRRLFIDTWEQLRPLLLELDQSDQIPEARGLELAAFIAGGDALRALDALGPEYGLEISRDGLRRLARLLLREDAPAAFTPLPLEVDPALRGLFHPGPHPLRDELTRGPAPSLLSWLIGDARATSSPAEALRGVVPRLDSLDDYLATVSLLLGQEAGARLGGESRVPHVFRFMIDPLVRATAWKESCWRQYTGPRSSPRVLTSSVGAVGMMQIHTRVWRGVYDPERLADDVQYNVRAGIEILEYYLVDYAIRRQEHHRPGGLDNLVRATYAAYNGGPSHLTRYRRDDVSASLRAIDREFWRHYQIMRETRWPDVGSCYPVQ
ncbi:MAG: transglycosylase SLT domain-containing protein [Ectothiorhodospiraceae bacterium]|nr:transglycosylase SLT domain-containing protein [Ectothiorhodospiraceae bacterium]